MKRISTTVLAFILVFAFTGCSKSNAQSGSGAGGGKANAATDFSYDMTADKQGILIKGYTGGPGKVVIPAKIEDLPVLEIGEGVFNGKTLTFSISGGTKPADVNVGSKANAKAEITSIFIPNTVRKIGNEAFANTAITSITIPDSVTEMEDGLLSGVFDGCKMLTEIRLSDNIEYLPMIAFPGLPALRKINLPKNLKRINKSAFLASGELIDLVIPDSLTSLEFGEYDIFGDNKWYKAGTTRNYNTIDNNAFSGCGKLPLKTRQRLNDLGYTGEF